MTKVQKGMERDMSYDTLIAQSDIVARQTMGGYELVKNRFGQTGYLRETAFVALRAEWPSARVLVM